MEFTLRQKTMFVLFGSGLAIIIMMTAYTGNLNILTSNLYFLLFLGALYLEKNQTSKYVLVLASAVMIVNMLLAIIQNVSYVITLKGILEVAAYVALYFFAMAFLKSGFRNKKTFYLILILSAPLLLFTGYDFIMKLFSYSNNLSQMWILLLNPLVNALFPLSMIIYSVLRHKNIQ